MKKQNSIRLLAAGTVLAVVTLTASAQQSPPASSAAQNQAPAAGAAPAAAPDPEKPLKLLADRLELTADQQTKMKPIILKLQQAAQKIQQDETVSPDERREKIRACLNQADQEVRELLTDDQKKKLDQVESEPHSELHAALIQPAAPHTAP